MENKAQIVRRYKHSCYQIVKDSGLLVNGRFKSRKYIDNKSKAAKDKKACRNFRSVK